MMNFKAEDKLIRKFLGVPYKHLGRDLAGLDCWGLAKMIYADLGIEIIDLDDYEQDWAKRGGNHFIDNYSKEWSKRNEPSFLDVLLFMNAHGVPTHAGVYLSNNRFIQSTKTTGVVVTELKSGWAERLEGVYHYDSIHLYL